MYTNDEILCIIVVAIIVRCLQTIAELESLTQQDGVVDLIAVSALHDRSVILVGQRYRAGVNADLTPSTGGPVGHACR